MMKRTALLTLLLFLIAGCVRPAMTVPPEDDGGDAIATMVAATKTVEAISKDYQDPPATVEAVQVSVTPDPDQPTGEPPTPEPSLAPTEAPTETIAPTPTHSPTPEISLTPSATLDPALAPEDPVLSLGDPDVNDTFDAGSIIYQYDDDDSSFQVEDGEFVIVAKKTSFGELWSFTADEVSDFYLEITGTFGDTCAGRDRYGMIFRAPDYTQGYLLSISCDGTYNLRYWDPDQETYTTLKNWTSSDLIESGPEGTNRLGVKVEGTTIAGYVNGKKLFEIEDSTFDGPRFGILIAAPNTAGFTVNLSQLVYWNLP
jgi:hypothetical protein